MHRLDCSYAVSAVLIFSTVHAPLRLSFSAVSTVHTPFKFLHTSSRLFTFRFNCPYTASTCYYIHRPDCSYIHRGRDCFIRQIDCSYTALTVHTPFRYFCTCSCAASTARAPSKLPKHRLDCSYIHRFDCSYTEPTVRTPFPTVHIYMNRLLNCSYTEPTVHTPPRLFVHRLPSCCLWGALRSSSSISPKSKPSLFGRGSWGSWSLC